MDIRISEDVPESYLAEVRHILSNSEFLLLDKYFHHHKTSRLTHSIHVSYLSWLLDRGEVSARFEGNTLLWQACSDGAER